MGYYSLKFTVPKNTAEENPIQQKIPVISGVLHQVLVHIPTGHKKVTGMAIDEGLHQLYPTNQNEWFTGNDLTYLYPDYHELSKGTRELVLRGYNTSTLYDHDFIVGIGIMPKEVYDSWMQLSKAMQPMIENMATLTQFFAPPKQQQE